MNVLQAWATRYRRWEDRMLAQIERPVVERPLARRTWFSRSPASRFSAVERQQIAALMRQYRGKAGLLATLKLLAAGSFLGALLKILRPDGLSWLQSLMIGNLILGSIVFAGLSAWINHQRYAIDRLKVRIGIALLAVLGVVVGAGFAAWEQGRPLLDALNHIAQQVLPLGVLFGSAYAMLLGLIAGLRNRELMAVNDSLQMAAEQERLARQLSDSQLKLLQAQIEPHFLFNTLGAVRQLAEDGAPRAAALTADLIQFLRSSLMQMRAEQVSLGEDFRLAEAYLKVMQVRLGSRLRFSLQLPAALENETVPTMMLLTLVENAIKHGIEPAVSGGEVRVDALAEGEHLVLRVADTGRGLSEAPGNGVGLANVRERLRLQFGEQARLALADNEPSGVIATLTLPRTAAMRSGQHLGNLVN